MFINILCSLIFSQLSARYVSIQRWSLWVEMAIHHLHLHLALFISILLRVNIFPCVVVMTDSSSQNDIYQVFP